MLGDGLDYTINSATSVTVTFPGGDTPNPFTADNIGRQHALRAALVAQQQGHAVGVRQTEIADRVLLHRD